MNAAREASLVVASLALRKYQSGQRKEDLLSKNNAYLV